MVNYRFLKRILAVGEKDILSRLTFFSDMSIKNSEYLIEMLKNYQSDLNNYNSMIRDNEKASDEMDVNLRHDVTSGAISSNLMDNILLLIEKCDDIVDKTYYVSREIKRYILNHKFIDDEENIIKYTYGRFIDILNKNIEALNVVKSILNENDINAMKEHRKTIESIEEEVDNIKDSVIDFSYKSSNTVSYITFEHINTLAHKLDDMLDDCEDIADLVFTIMLSVTS
ncbi:DUF47 family protein [Picrophilus oshimae]|uniref:Hypothetical exported protein n=1 Tax=Picrophilus torridus (strain ATCC 700027 / DSM 9790 / JCM 10055 / NBRC 100828 / KAW 2/3) TaxID=1122961 RepID=Q6KZD9_PICTO|nr:DUF47 family protein [Picrophilus oshimae]AAT43913.1 hypothetical exported protein [Picrophilus oshimae DSM 9789]SMD31016.1 hypothetical protein SAMN02745355_0934 [Picrophilus oshimae DSM 9789]